MRYSLLIVLAAVLLSVENVNAQTPVDTASAAVSAVAVKEQESIDFKKLEEPELTKLVFETVNSGDTNAIKPMLKALLYYRHNEAGETVLTQAIVNNDAAMVRVLVRDAVINLKSKTGETPLTLALKKGNPEIIKWVAQRAKAGLKNDNGEAPIMLALEKNDLYLLQTLINKGADVNTRSTGVTAIARATELNDLQTVALLLRNGADPSIANANGEIPLYIAVSKGYDVISGVLLHKSKQQDKDANWNNKLGEPLLNRAAFLGNERIMKILLDYGANPTALDNMENTALHIAAEKGYTDLVKIMLDKGAPVDQPNLIGTTPIMAAAQNSHSELAKILADAGANPDRRNYEGIAANDYGSYQMKQLMQQEYDELVNEQLTKEQPNNGNNK